MSMGTKSQTKYQSKSSSMLKKKAIVFITAMQEWLSDKNIFMILTTLIV